MAFTATGSWPIGTSAYQKLVARAFRKSAGFTVAAFSAQFLHQLHQVPVPNASVVVDPSSFNWRASTYLRELGTFLPSGLYQF